MPRLRVLLYHSISADGSRDHRTVSSTDLEKQFQHLCRAGYQSISLSELIAYSYRGTPLPRKPVLLTFDDGYLDHATIVYPLAKTYRMKINLFVIPFFIISGGYRSIPCIRPADLEKMDPALVEVGLHSYAHFSYADLEPNEIEWDIDRSLHSLREMGIAYQKCLAYPFGALPRGGHDARRKLFELLRHKGIQLAFCFGNRVNPLPFREKFFIERIEVRGNESLARFRLNLGFGRKIW